MPDKFDVIIVGSGAGGGTLVCQLLPTGKRILILERGDWLKHGALNWDARPYSSTVDTSFQTPGTIATGGCSNHKFFTLSLAPPKCMARPSTAYAGKTSGNPTSMAESRPPGRSATTTLNLI